jgi:hypothetical protein
VSRLICANTTHALKNYLDSEIRTCKHDIRINASPLLCQLVYQRTWATNRSIAFTSFFHSEDSEKSSTLILDFLQISQTCWCLYLIDVPHKTLQLMEGIDKPHTGKYKEITNDSIMTPTVRLYHFRYGTLKISSTWFFLCSVQCRSDVIWRSKSGKGVHHDMAEIQDMIW